MIGRVVVWIALGEDVAGDGLRGRSDNLVALSATLLRKGLDAQF